MPSPIAASEFAVFIPGLPAPTVQRRIPLREAAHAAPQNHVSGLARFRDESHTVWELKKRVEELEAHATRLQERTALEGELGTAGRDGDRGDVRFTLPPRASPRGLVRDGTGGSECSGVPPCMEGVACLAIPHHASSQA